MNTGRAWASVRIKRRTRPDDWTSRNTRAMRKMRSMVPIVPELRAAETMEPATRAASTQLDADWKYCRCP